MEPVASALLHMSLGFKKSAGAFKKFRDIVRDWIRTPGHVEILDGCSSDAASVHRMTVIDTVVGHNPAPLYGAPPFFTLIGFGFRP